MSPPGRPGPAAPVFGVTGWKNSGKTTLTERLVAEMSRRGCRVSTVKHAHHAFDIDHPGTDSFRHRAAGGDSGTIALAATSGRVHPVFGLWPVALADDLAGALRDGVRKVMAWVERHPHAVCDFGRFDADRDPFFNANTPEELATVEALIREDAL